MLSEKSEQLKRNLTDAIARVSDKHGVKSTDTAMLGSFLASAGMNLREVYWQNVVRATIEIVEFTKSQSADDVKDLLAEYDADRQQREIAAAADLLTKIPANGLSH